MLYELVTVVLLLCNPVAAVRARHAPLAGPELPIGDRSDAGPPVVADG